MTLDPTAIDPQEKDRGSAPEARPPAVFVVDDDEPVRDSTRALLESHNIEVFTYASAGDFLAAAAFRDGDCLLLDNHMPGMTGMDLVDALRARDACLPVIMFTGRGDGTLKARALRAGVLAVLDKPVNEDHLLQAVTLARHAAAAPE